MSDATEPRDPVGLLRGRTFELGTNKVMALLVVVWVGVLVRATSSPRDEILTERMVLLLAVAATALLLFRVVARAIAGKTKVEAQTSSLAESPSATEVWSVRPLLLVPVVLVSTLAWSRVSPGFESFAATEGGYYWILLSGGYGLSRWCDSREYVPVLMAGLSLAAVVTGSTIEFLNDPAIRWVLGPETVIVAEEKALNQVPLLPLDATVAWGGWLIGQAIKTRSRRARENTDNALA